jgi:hypothetical protein
MAAAWGKKDKFTWPGFDSVITWESVITWKSVTTYVQVQYDTAELTRILFFVRAPWIYAFLLTGSDKQLNHQKIKKT